jgi:hypothetical protein
MSGKMLPGNGTKRQKNIHWMPERYRDLIPVSKGNRENKKNIRKVSFKEPDSGAQFFIKRLFCKIPLFLNETHQHCICSHIYETVHSAMFALKPYNPAGFELVADAMYVLHCSVFVMVFTLITR